jgi:hypothetical protein
MKPVTKAAEKVKYTREMILENLLRALLEEVAVRDGMRRISKMVCTGCQRSSKPFHACHAAWSYLESEYNVPDPK